jgi:Zn-dependent protease with chaperone function
MLYRVNLSIRFPTPSFSTKFPIPVRPTLNVKGAGWFPLYKLGLVRKRQKNQVFSEESLVLRQEYPFSQQGYCASKNLVFLTLIYVEYIGIYDLPHPLKLTMLKGMGRAGQKVTYKFYQRLFWGLGAVILVTPVIYWASGSGQTAESLSAAVLRQSDGGLLNSPKAEAFHNLLLPLRLQSFLMYPFLLLVFQLSGGAVALREWLDKGITLFLASSPIAKWQSHLSRFGRFIPLWGRQLAGQKLWVVLGFVVVFNVGLALLYFPLNFYRGFVVAHQFGLSTQAISGWLRDWGVNLFIGLALDGVIFGGFYSLLHLFPRRWPIPGGFLLVLFSFVLSLLAPLLITPLFYEVRPLEDPILRERILTLAERANMPVDNIYVIDASTKTTQVNAYVTSFGQAQRMVLYDTLLEGYPLDQVEVVVSHELGHWSDFAAC